MSPSGQSSIPPDQLVADCNNLIAHLTNEVKAAKEEIDKWVKSIKDRELMEKRRVAPGWLDTGVVMLEPVKVGPSSTFGETGAALVLDQKTLGVSSNDGKGKQVATSPGEELDRAFGGLGV